MNFAKNFGAVVIVDGTEFVTNVLTLNLWFLQASLTKLILSNKKARKIWLFYYLKLLQLHQPIELAKYNQISISSFSRPAAR